MSYSIHELAEMANISVRTLHYYDEIDLLDSGRNPKNKYRVYEEEDLLRLQQILFFRELDFKLADIKAILEYPDFDLKEALRDHKEMILLKKKRLDKLVKTIDKTINKINKRKNMKDEELYDAFSLAEYKKYADEAKQKWGNTEAYKESQKRLAQMTKADVEKYKKEGDEITRELSSCMDESPESERVQKLVERHYKWLSHWYEPNLEMYRGLGQMYVDDPRFTETYDKYAKGLAQFLRDAIVYFVEKRK